MIDHHSPPPIIVADLLPRLDTLLYDLLHSLAPEDWFLPTIASKWNVKDVTSHLLDGSLRGLSASRDNWFGEPPGDVQSYEELVNYINRLNMDWVLATRRLSPTLLITLLEVASSAYTAHLLKLKPYDDAVFAVSWAGHQTSPNWFHVAREYTEKFLHQQQIRDAVARQALLTKELYFPFLDIMMYALPVTYNDVKVPEGTTVTVRIPSDAGGQWSIIKNSDGWQRLSQHSTTATATITIEPYIAWQLFSKSVSPEHALKHVTFEGDKSLGLVALNMVSVMA